MLPSMIGAGDREEEGQEEKRRGKSAEEKSIVEFVNPIGRRSFVASFGIKFPVLRNPGNPLAVVGPTVIRSPITRRSLGDDVSLFTRRRADLRNFGGAAFTSDRALPAFHLPACFDLHRRSDETADRVNSSR